MKKIKKKKVAFLQKMQSFLTVQFWIQSLKFKALGSWYFIEMFQVLADRIFPIANSFILALIINEVIRLATQTNKDLSLLTKYVVVTLMINLIYRIIQFFYNRNYWLMSERKLDYYLEDMFLEKLATLNWEHIETPTAEKYINMTFQRAWGHLKRTSEIHFEIIAITVGAALAFNLGKIPLWMITIVLAKQVPFVLLDMYHNRRMFSISDSHMKENVQIGWVFSYFRDFESLLEIKISSATKPLLEYRANLINYVTNQFKKVMNITNHWYFLSIITDVVVSFGVTIYYLGQILYQGMQIGTFNFTTTAIFNVSSSFGNLMGRMNRLFDGYRYIRYAYNLMHIKNKIPNGIIPLVGEHIKIEFQDVSFRYPKSRKWALNHVSFTIEDNARIAIVGENGAGKSTFLKLLMLAYYPTKGDILINDIPIRKYDKETIFKSLALVSQEFARFGAQTIAENIAIYGDIRNIDQKKLKLAADYSTAAEFVEKYPLKYETILTKRIEGGTELSSGQWQRIAVARQFYANRPLIVLDEPTSAIDPIAEAKIFNNLYEHVKDKTVIIVSHRYNTVRAAKRILVFQEGSIIEQGTHDELIALNGYYAQAFSVQQQEKKL